MMTFTTLFVSYIVTVLIMWLTVRWLVRFGELDYLFTNVGMAAIICLIPIINLICAMIIWILYVPEVSLYLSKKIYENQKGRRILNKIFGIR